MTTHAKPKFTEVYATIIVFNILFCVAFYASHWAPIVSLSLYPQINECSGFHMFADMDFLKVFLVQMALSIVLHVSGVWWMTSGLLSLKSIRAMWMPVFAPFLTALIVLKLEPFFVECVI